MKSKYSLIFLMLLLAPTWLYSGENAQIDVTASAYVPVAAKRPDMQLGFELKSPQWLEVLSATLDCSYSFRHQMNSYTVNAPFLMIVEIDSAHQSKTAQVTLTEVDESGYCISTSINPLLTIGKFYFSLGAGIDFGYEKQVAHFRYDGDVTLLAPFLLQPETLGRGNYYDFVGYISLGIDADLFNSALTCVFKQGGYCAFGVKLGCPIFVFRPRKTAF